MTDISDSFVKLAKWKTEFFPTYRTICLIQAKVKDAPCLGTDTHEA